MKNFIVACGGFLTDLFVFLQLIIVIVLSVSVGIFVSDIDSTLGFWVGIATFLLLFIIFIFSNYIFCMFTGLCEDFSSISKSLKTIANNTKSFDTNTTVDTQSLKCPNCGKRYSNGDKFCEECCTKLD